MTKTTQSLLLSLALFAAAADAQADRDLPFRTELDTCLSAIKERIDLGGAERVRHVVLDTEGTLTGYELKIDTTVYAAGAAREYSAVCATRGALRPSKLEIRDPRS